MPKIKYKDFRFTAASRQLIATCNAVIEEYQAQGFQLTLRQLYYQLVSRDIIANTQNEYKRLGSIVNDARLAGLIDWNAIEDRTRNLHDLPHWDDPESLVDACSEQFRMNMWNTQKYRPEVWIEKDALIGVIEGVCEELDVPYFSCRGYTSQSEMWVAGRRLLRNAGPKTDRSIPIIFHFGDHDPSGKDMTRDIVDRLELFTDKELKLERLALNMDQIEKYKPPPNPAKLTDSRCQGYIAEFGNDSWELDALEPSVIAELVRAAISRLIDRRLWKRRAKEIDDHRKMLKLVSERWEEVVEVLKGN